MKEKVICYIMIMVAMDLFCSLKFLRFFKSLMFNVSEKSDSERVKLEQFLQQVYKLATLRYDNIRLDQPNQYHTYILFTLILL